jgi:hypothetical protein
MARCDDHALCSLLFREPDLLLMTKDEKRVITYCAPDSSDIVTRRLWSDWGMSVSSAGLLPIDPISVFVLTCRSDQAEDSPEPIRVQDGTQCDFGTLMKKVTPEKL